MSESGYDSGIDMEFYLRDTCTPPPSSFKTGGPVRLCPRKFNFCSLTTHFVLSMAELVKLFDCFCQCILCVTYKENLLVHWPPWYMATCWVCGEYHITEEYPQGLCPKCGKYSPHEWCMKCKDCGFCHPTPSQFELVFLAPVRPL